MAQRRTLLPCVLAIAMAAAFWTAPAAFVPAPLSAASKQTMLGQEASAMAVGAATGFLAIEPAHADMYKDEIFPIAAATSGAILWGIVLGFVLLRLQEAFPE
eukprot:CAMPEP_0197621934 /NCGR_PEP_ID=MMETSP1338-20131121/2359_1 /TAXON_ID=43686 ORGANISM="Pelagodinium beii, Strain RCC1491" /NCGR_SAMPLE_ID=MMETSP1338 /ASSEMBLY_ACC=CAM_ASM_000754 /LENGTH=101 /DNA_ID=CAMNT_0043191519 /DNA_START=82 /DNA_END=387 /DNA_ORIENTATION=-